MSAEAFFPVSSLSESDQSVTASQLIRVDLTTTCIMHYQEEGDDQRGSKLYGTPFPALKDEEAPSKKADIDLTVRDEQGRRRFHGAFTGGFSAGYWNTVGSKEGWVPSQFVSSRKEKWDRDLVKGKPEDFMDEEDFMVHGIAPKSVHTKDLFSNDPMSDFVSLRPPAASSKGTTASTSTTGESDLVDFRLSDLPKCRLVFKY